MIPPALTREEWTHRAFDGVCISADWMDQSIEIFDVGEGTKVSLFGAPRVVADAPRLIAALNAALPDTDPRKIGGEYLAALREVVAASDALNGAKMISGGMLQVSGTTVETLRDLADALASYLPPRDTP